MCVYKLITEFSHNMLRFNDNFSLYIVVSAVYKAVDKIKTLSPKLCLFHNAIFYTACLVSL